MTLLSEVACNTGKYDKQLLQKSIVCSVVLFDICNRDGNGFLIYNGGLIESIKFSKHKQSSYKESFCC